MRAKEILEHLGIRPSKGRGQNFLIDEEFAESVLDFAGVSGESAVLEIGGGLGALTERIVRRTHELHVVEVEERLCRYLEERFPELRGRVIHGDVRSVRLGQFAAPAKLTIVGNVPYSISSELVFWLLDERDHARCACFLLQREFAERIAAREGSRAYGIISVMRELYATAELGPIIAGNAFHPPASVESRVVRLTFRDHPVLADVTAAEIRGVVGAAFAQRRKTVVNSLAGSGVLSKAAALECLERSGIAPERRAETLSIDDFARLARERRQFLATGQQ